MKKTLKGYLLGFISATLLLSGVVYAASNTKTIEIIYDNIKVYKDNVLCETKDANGNVVEPFIYNGTTYMPVRGTANLAGMDVTWDGTTKSVYLWDSIPPETNEITYLLDVCPPYSGQGYYVDDFEMSGESYKGVYIGATTDDCYALVNLNGEYSSMNMTVGPAEIDALGVYPAIINFYLDGKNVKTIEIKEDDYPKEISLPLNGAKQLKIENKQYEAAPGVVGFGNITLK